MSAMDDLIDRMARARYERYDSHYAMAGGMSWEEYKADDPDGALGLYVADVQADLEDATDAMTALIAEVWDEGFDAGEQDVLLHAHDGWSSSEPCIPNPYREPDHAPVSRRTETTEG